MTFFYYEIQTRRFIQSTNIRALEEFSGISYNKIRGWFINGNVLYVDESVICGCSDLVRGKQRLTKKEVPLSDYQKERIENMIKDGRVFQEPDQTGTGYVGITGSTGPSSDTITIETKIRRETRQPDKRDGSGFDDFFKEVK